MSSEETKEIQSQENFSNNLASNLEKKIMNLHATDQRFNQSLKDIQAQLSSLSQTSTSSSSALSKKLQDFTLAADV
jgi:hypothetical protein